MIDTVFMPLHAFQITVDNSADCGPGSKTSTKKCLNLTKYSKFSMKHSKRNWILRQGQVFIQQYVSLGLNKTNN